MSSYKLVALSISFYLCFLLIDESRGLPRPRNGSQTVDSDIYRNTSELIRSRGYTVEEHYVTTKDGFVLNIQRIPRGRYEQVSPGRKPVVFLQHGLLMDSSNWVINSPSESLGYILADRGFDVWLGNIRGNVYSQRHVSLNPDQREFWNWSWENMAAQDLPAMLEYVLNRTGQADLFYVGHSQGTLIGFTAFSSYPELAKKVKIFFALAPVYTVTHCSSFIRDTAYALYPVEEVFQNHVNRKFEPEDGMKLLTKHGICSGKLTEEFCYDAGQNLFGFDSSNINMTRVPAIIAHFGSGTSFKNMVHFGQMILSGKCQKYDYGFFGNWERYNQFEPTVFDVKQMKTPTVMFSGSNDKLADPKDVMTLKRQITNLLYFREIPGWNHADFLFGIDAPRVMYSRMLKIMNDMNIWSYTKSFNKRNRTRSKVKRI